MNAETLAGEGLNTAWLDAQAVRQEHRAAQADALSNAATVEDVFAAMPLDDTDPELYAADDLLDVAIQAETHAERERMAGYVGDATRSLDNIREMIESSGVPLTLDEQQARYDHLSAEDRTPLATGEAWVDYAGRDRMSRPSDDWIMRGSVARRVVVTDIAIRRASNGNMFATVTFDTARATGVRLNLWGTAAENVQIGRGILHVRRENGYINGVGFCPIREGGIVQRIESFDLERDGKVEATIVYYENGKAVAIKNGEQVGTSMTHAEADGRLSSWDRGDTFDVVGPLQ